MNITAKQRNLLAVIGLHFITITVSSLKKLNFNLHMRTCWLRALSGKVPGFAQTAFHDENITYDLNPSINKMSTFKNK